MFWFHSRASFSMKIHCFQRNLFLPSIPSPPSFAPVHLPSPKETHLWYIIPDEIKSASLLDQYFDLLSSREKEKVFAIRGDQLRKRAILARALVRTTIARYQLNSKITPRSLKFRNNFYGKPEVEWEHCEDLCPLSLDFNISHTSSMIACGVTLDSPIGIDMEEKQRKLKNNILSLARRYFSLYEVDLLSTISDSEVQRQEFLKLWTLKEAYVKALGRGFSATPFNTFTLRLKNATQNGAHVLGDPGSEACEIVVECKDDPGNLRNDWRFKLVELSGSHFAAICMKNDDKGLGSCNVPMKLTAWKTIPFLHDECVSGTDEIREII